MKYSPEENENFQNKAVSNMGQYRLLSLIQAPPNLFHLVRNVTSILCCITSLGMKNVPPLLYHENKAQAHLTELSSLQNSFLLIILTITLLRKKMFGTKNSNIFTLFKARLSPTLTASLPHLTDSCRDSSEDGHHLDQI